MATYTTRTVTTRRHEWVVPAAEPWGATWEEVTKAAAAAAAHYRDHRGLAPDGDLPGDFARVHVTDDAVVITVTTEEAGR